MKDRPDYYKYIASGDSYYIIKLNKNVPVRKHSGTFKFIKLFNAIHVGQLWYVGKVLPLAFDEESLHPITNEQAMLELL